MKIIIFFFFLSCVSAFAAATNDIRVATTTNTETEMGVAITVDVFTRDGETNLVCSTRTKGGSLRDRWQKFYHKGSLLGVYSTYNNGSSTIHSFGSAPYTLSFVFDSCDKMKCANILSNSVMLDAFFCINGIFYPADRSVIREVQSAVKGMLPVDLK
jgi:hypothetical protein